MTDNSIYENNPLHGLSLENLLAELVGHYGFDILDAYLNVNCFKKNASIESSVKFLKKTDWAREKVEGFYLYKFKNLPKASGADFDLPPRDRIIPMDQKPGEPAELSLEEAERLRVNRVKQAAEFNKGGYGSGSYNDRSHSKPRSNSYANKPYSSSQSTGSSSSDSDDGQKSDGPVDPWGKLKKK